jgi:glutaconate CoA-transferase subunit B
VYPGVTPDQAKAATGWDLAVSGDLEVLDPPSAGELSALRALQAATPRSEGASDGR